MGWIWLFLIGLAAFALLRLGDVRRSLFTLVAATLLFGGAGYALQQNAALPGSPASPDVRRIEVDPGLVAFRSAIMPTSPTDTATLAAADDRLRDGDPSTASQILLDAVARQPDNAALWTGVGSVLVAHGGGKMSPAARHAFARAIQLAPNKPGPHFFLGLAQVEGDDLAAAKASWLRALERTPRDAPYRIIIAERLVMLDQILAMGTNVKR